jgi:hypothetical protein
MPMRILVDLPITFDVGDQQSHAPMIDVLVGTTPTRLILDTGSTDHVLTIELARAVGLAAEPGEPGTDHAGASVESWTLGEVGARIGDHDLTLRDSVAITGPAPFEGWGVGGFLSPQHLDPVAFAVLDFVGHRFRLIDADGDDWTVLGSLAREYPDLDVMTLPRVAGEATPVVLAAIEPFPPVPAMLNTGGRGTEFATNAVPGLVGVAPDSVGHGVGGSVVRGAVVGERTLRVGSATFRVPGLLVRDEVGSMQGLIGMDVLRGTVLVVSADERRPVVWLAPRPGSAC